MTCEEYVVKKLQDTEAELKSTNIELNIAKKSLERVEEEFERFVQIIAKGATFRVSETYGEYIDFSNLWHDNENFDFIMRKLGKMLKKEEKKKGSVKDDTSRENG